MVATQTAVVTPGTNLAEGKEEVIVVKDRPVPEPAAGEVLVNIYLRPVVGTDQCVALCDVASDIVRECASLHRTVATVDKAVPSV